MTEPFKIDVHHHVVPEIYAEAVANAGGDPSGFPTPKWSPTSTLEFMKKASIQKSIISVTAPGATIAKDNAPKLSRGINEYVAKLRDQYPEQLGFFASVPSLKDTNAAISEIKYALDVLGADGITLFTRYGPGSHYLGHQTFEPVLKELNDRKAVVFIHPTHANDTTLVNPMLFQPLIDYTHETTRTALDLITSGSKAKFRDIKFILSHAGGTLPFVVERAAKLLANLDVGEGLTEEGIMRDARSFYFDLALSCSPIQVKSLLEFVGPERILYGSDFPYAPERSIMSFGDQLKEIELSDEVRERMYNGTAKELFPKSR